MLREPDKTKYFDYTVEKGQNPYCGIMSFQHFRGEELYSDIVVKPENNMCETENVECYPIPDHVEQNGREQGYYPDNTVAYIRVLWKEFEPEQGVYDYGFIEDIIAKARSKRQSLIFRLMPHSTRACDDVPEWLKKLIPCPERPEGKRIKASPTDPLFIKLFCDAVRKIGERFDSDPVFDAIDISMPGAWGEGYNLHLYSDEDIGTIFDTYVESFKSTQLISQYKHTDILNYLRQRTNIGWRADGLGDPHHTDEIYPPLIEQISDYWKTAPVSFESYWWMTEWKRKGWDLDVIIEKTLNWHISSFNPKSLPIPYEWEKKVRYWISKMGYHYRINSFSYPEKALPSDSIKMILDVENVGVAPSYHKIPLYIRLRGNDEYVFETDIDIRKWMLGKHKEEISIDIPKNMPAGRYNIDISIYDDPVGNVYFATDADFNDGWYELGEINICN
ncbi:MAG: DUF4832 domain-containing protein [Clostridiales bacterium]|nr:DUF4832 domain-containing protein [Clostridiales bacterium]